ncbi:MAG: hypothetical protein U0871_22840 [Gemmataceae bacterium]
MPQPPLPSFDEPPSGYLTRAEAERQLVPLANDFSEVWHGAWTDWLSLPDEIRSQLAPTTRANVVHDLAVGRAKGVFGQRDGFRVCEELGFFKLYVGNSIVVRLKRLGDDDHLARNIQTDQQKQWYLHRPIPGVPDGCTRLTVGYSLDRAQVGLRDVVVSLQDGPNQLVYSFSINAEPQTTLIPIAPIPPDTKPTVQPKIAPREAGQI